VPGPVGYTAIAVTGLAICLITAVVTWLVRPSAVR
jgi:hypothetical protein